MPYSDDVLESCTFSILLVSTWLSRLKNRYETLFSDLFYPRDGPKIVKCQKNKEWDIKTWNSLAFRQFYQQNLERRFGTSKMHLSPPVA